jgi:hypothetical protein
MKPLLLLLLCFLSTLSFGQSFQLHYNLRHTLDPEHNNKNYPTLYFEYFKNIDTAKTPGHLGPFLLKTQADFTGDQSNVGQFYVQVFQQFRFWRPKLYLSVQYSGGLGVTDPRQYSYYINNSYSLGVSVPFKLGGAFVSAGLDYKYTAYQRPSGDPFFSFYFWRGLFNYHAEFAGDFTVWTQNRNHGDDLTRDSNDKTMLFFAEPQFWYKLDKDVAIGSKVNLYYHILRTDNSLQVYPTAAIRVRL